MVSILVVKLMARSSFFGSPDSIGDFFVVVVRWMVNGHRQILDNKDRLNRIRDLVDIVRHVSTSLAVVVVGRQGRWRQIELQDGLRRAAIVMDLEIDSDLIGIQDFHLIDFPLFLILITLLNSVQYLNF